MVRSARPVDICALRLVNQHLDRQVLERASDVVSRFGAVQAQEYAPAKWAVAQRTRGVTDAEVEKEFADGSILRTHLLRPTWHFVAPADIRWMLKLTGPRVKAILGHYDKTLGIDGPVLKKSRAVLTKALRDGKQLTRAELRDALTRARIKSDDSVRLARIVMHAEQDGLICSGARRGKQFTYALLDERVPPAKERERDESLGELATRYFTPRGPATIDDFAWWSGLTKADCKRAVQIAGEHLNHAVVDKREYWMPLTTGAVKAKSPLVRLLPSYDEYFIGLKDRSAIHRKLEGDDLRTANVLIFRHVVIIDGQIVAGWSWKPKGASTEVELKPLTRISESDQRLVTREVARFGAFLQTPTSLATLPRTRS